MTLPAIDPATLFDVRGKSALIVGATGSFGKVVCATLGRAGARLTVTAGNAAALEALVGELAHAGITAAPVALRPSTTEYSAAIVAAAVAAHGSLDILVVASGANDVAPIAEMDHARFQAVMQANVDGAWLIAQAAGRQMIAQGRGGKVILTSSARGKLGHPAG